MRIALLGDVSLTGVYDLSESSIVENLIMNVQKAVCDCDYVICNLESPLTSIESTHMCKGAYLRSNPQNVQVLKSLGVTHVTLANNHIFDYGKVGAKETIKVLKNNSIEYCGLCGDPISITKGEDRVLLEGFCCYSANGIYYGKKPLSIKTLNFSSLNEFLNKSKKEDRLPIASVHYGVERLHYPSPEHMKLFRSLAEKYDYVLHGNHTHSIQGYEKYNNSLLCYSLGNLLFDDVKTTSIKTSVKQTDETRKTYISIIEVKNNALSNYHIIPFKGTVNGDLFMDNTVGKELHNYCDKLELAYEDIIELRREEIAGDARNAPKRDSSFYFNRLNYKYIGAFVNGIIHSKKYKKIFYEYFE